MKQLFILFFFLTAALQAQFQINGIVKDSISNDPLAFASISVNGEFTTITDIDGKFVLNTNNKAQIFKVSYVGYYPKAIKCNLNKYYNVLLSPRLNNLNELFTAANEATAIAIIKKVIAYKSNNNPQKKLKSFEFKNYNKLIISANPDSIVGKIDSVFVKKRKSLRLKKIDSSDFKFNKLIASQHLFETEKASQFQFSKNKLKETVSGIRMSGFNNNPVYEIIGFNLQSFSVYDYSYELFETKYNSPIAKDAFSNYNFRLLDTLEIQNRKVYLIYFKPKNIKKNLGIQGVLYIDQNNFAVAKALIRLKGVLDVTATHDFQYISNEDLWFPTEKEFKIVKGKNKEDIKILGETFKFDADGTDIIVRKKQNSDFVYLISKSFNFELKYNIPVKIIHPAIAIDIQEDATNQTNQFWKLNRKYATDARSEKTYFALDSIAKKENVEVKLRLGRKIFNGYVPLGCVDIDLRSLLSYNNYEGFRPGIGGITNEKFSKNYRIEGYGAYGTKDGVFKYSFGTAQLLAKFSNTWLGGNYTNDVREIASSNFAIDKRIFKLYDPRPINVSTFYNYKSWRAYIETKFIPKTESILQIAQSRIEPKFQYFFNLNEKTYTVFNMTTAMVSVQWNPFSNYMQTPAGRVEIDKQYPKFTFQFTKSIPNVLENDFDFGKIDFKAEYQKKYLNGQKTAVFTEVGYAFGALPITHLYNNSPNNLTKENIVQRITIAGKNSFETMFFNEFFSSQYIQFQIKHGSKRVTLFKKVRPSVVLVTRGVWGTMKNPQQHLGIDFKTLEKGFFESGIELNQIYKGFGLSGFFRYGPNQLFQFEDNIAIKLNYVLDLGI